MKIIKFIIIIFAVTFLAADDYIELNFFIQPEFSIAEMNLVNFFLKNIRSDSLPQQNILAGKLLQKQRSDSTTADFIKLIEPDLIAPTDFFFSETDLQIKIFAANIKSDSLFFIPHKIISTDSMKIGIFAIYTPDFTVKNKLPDHIKFEFDVFNVARSQFEMLKNNVDYLIMLSNLGKYIDREITRQYPVDAVVSFDYKKKANGWLNNGTRFYSIITSSGNYGKLRLRFHQGKITEYWQEKLFFEMP